MATPWFRSALEFGFLSSGLDLIHQIWLQMNFGFFLYKVPAKEWGLAFVIKSTGRLKPGMLMPGGSSSRATQLTCLQTHCPLSAFKEKQHCLASSRTTMKVCYVLQGWSLENSRGFFSPFISLDSVDTRGDEKG